MSDNKVDNKLDFRNMKSSQFGGSQIERSEFSELQSAKRVYQTNAILKDAYTHFIQTLNGNGYPTLVEYWQATDPAIDKLQFGADVAGNKAGTYFILQEYLTKRTHVFYYVVSGSGTAPGIGDVETPINIETNDSAALIAYATKPVVESLGEFYVKHPSILSSYIEIEYYQFGNTSAIDVGTSGFISTRLKNGSSFKVGEVHLDYDVNGDVIYGGNTLKGMLYNPYTASFDIERASVEVSTIVDLKRPSGFNVTEIAVANAGVETEIVLPDNTKRFKIQAREANTELQITNATSGDYFTVRYGCHYEEDGLETSGVTLYVTTSRDNRIIELLTWS